MSAYYAVWAAPRWGQTIAAPLAMAGTSPAAAVAGVMAFSAVYVTHTFAQVSPRRLIWRTVPGSEEARLTLLMGAQGWVQQAEGAMAVTLVAAVRSAVVTLCAAALAAMGSAAGQPLTARSAASAAVVMVGGLLWVRCSSRAPMPAPGAVPAQLPPEGSGA